MAVMDEFKEERANLKNAPLNQKIAYFWEYYKWYAIIPLVIVIALTSYIYHMVTKPDVFLSGIFLNAHTAEAQTLSDNLAEEFCKKNKIDTKEYEFNINATLSWEIDGSMNNYETSQALMTWVGAGTIDFIGADVDTMNNLAYKGYFIDLREVLTKEEIAKYEPYFLYMDQAVLENQDKSLESDQDVSSTDYPDCTKPEDMEEPIPIFISLDRSKQLDDIFSGEEPLALGITAKAENQSRVLDFLDFITK